jgi:hypothetical protein
LVPLSALPVWADTPFDFAQGRLCPPLLVLTWIYPQHEVLIKSLV